MKVPTSIWPYDVYEDPSLEAREDPNTLTCFIITPFSPCIKYDDLFNLIQEECNKVGRNIHCKINCIRSDKITSPGVIHAEIWQQIKTADAVIADVSGLNGNCMIELGVASAWREKHHVIIIKERNPDERFLFDIGPVRHIIYDRTASGYSELRGKLFETLLMSLTSAPYKFIPKEPVELPLSADFTSGKDVSWLYGPRITHRRIREGYLEFGSLHIFKNSWLSAADLQLKNFKLDISMKFTETRNVKGFIGVSIRNQHFFANFGHLLFLDTDGNIQRTVPENEFGKYRDDPIDKLQSFNIKDDVFHDFKIEVNDKIMALYIDDIGDSYKIEEMPYVFAEGRILIQTFNARVGIKDMHLEDA